MTGLAQGSEVIMTTLLRKSWKLGALVGIGVGVIAVAYFVWTGWGHQDLMAAAEQAAVRKDFRSVEQLCQRLLAREPRSMKAIVLAADAAERLGHKDRALDYLDSLPDDHAEGLDQIQFHRGELALELGRLSTAETSFRKAVTFNPKYLAALRRLCFVLRIEGRNWESREFLQALAGLEPLGMDELFLLGSTEWVWLDRREAQFIDYCLRTIPEDPLPGLGRVRQSLLREEVAPARPYLKAIVDFAPEIGEAQARLGVILAQGTDDAEFLEWNRRLPAAAELHPGIWFSRGLWLRKQDHFQEAIRCFGESISRDPNHRGACSQLSQTFGLLDDIASSRVFVRRAKTLAVVEETLREVQQSPDMIRVIVEALLDLGRDFEAEAWIMTVPQQSIQPWVAQAKERIAGSGHVEGTHNAPFQRPFHSMDWSTFPLPDWKSIAAKPTSKTESVTSEDLANVSFEDVAASVGISFQYTQKTGAKSGVAYMYEFSGGGVAVLDMDADGWPDIYLTQGSGLPATSTWKDSPDKLFRSTGKGQFQDVTRQASLANPGFGQGVTVGDFDNDGFPDMYVANIGANVLYRNQGDGTFEDVTATSDTGGSVWSLGAAMADLNGDSLPDLYVVNYLGGPNVFSRTCQASGRPVQCPPGGFPAEQDRVYQNLGDGRFQDVTREWGFEVPDGKGMGIVVADFQETGQPQIFVANDTTANFLFVREPSDESGSVRFLEKGALAGVAFNDVGNTRSSMGVACGDANADGLLDLLVTNYIRESNSLLVQRNDHTFEEQARRAGLREPSLDKMGWGTQFLDIDSDGLIDLAVANGHLDDYSAGGIPFKMSTQIFRNQGQQRFQQVMPNRLGPYFSRQVLGRAVARLDWNRDGRDDLAVTHVDVPFALLSNTSASSNNRLVLSLRGVESSRDAIGAIVRIVVGDRVLIRHITAGDGFEASNERKLCVGMGAADHAKEVQVRWPSGRQQIFENVSTDHEWILIENRFDPIACEPSR